LDDTFWRRILPQALVRSAARSADEPESPHLQLGVSVALFALVAYLSIDPISNLISRRQMMNTSFGAFDLVNSYGAFGVVGRERDEIIFEGTDDASITGDTQWRAYEFKAKPGDPSRAPPFIAPYQPRIDWQIWFAAMASPSEYPWTLHFVWRLLHNDTNTLSLLANNPFPNAPPRYIRARLFRYHFTAPGQKGWWTREPIGEWLPALAVTDPEFRRVLAAMDWLD
jgi:Lipase maturation factor